MKSPLARLLLACFAIAAAPLAVRATNAPTAPHTHSDTPGGGAVPPEVVAAQQKVNDLAKQLHALQTQMDNLKATEPQDPGPNATEAQRKKYKQDHARWQAQFDKVQHQIDVVSQKLAEAQKDLEAAKRKAAAGGH